MRLKRIPYINYYFIGFIIYNLTAILFSFIIMFRIYSFINYYDESLFKVVLIYNTSVSIILYIIYIEFNFNNYEYNIDPKLAYSYKIIGAILLSIFPLMVGINLFAFLLNINFSNYFHFHKFTLFNTIHCDPVEGGSSSQINSNTQTNSQSNQQLITRTESSDSVCTIKNLNVQSNSQTNTQETVQLNEIRSIINKPMVTPYEEMFNKVENQAQTILNTGSFWANIKFLEEETKGITSQMYINEKLELSLNRTLNTSAFNKMAFENSLVNVDKLCLNINNVKEIFFNKPVLLNNQYEVKLNIINYPIYHDETALNLIKFYNGIKAESLFYNGKTVLNLIKESSDCILYEGDLKKKLSYILQNYILKNN